MYKFLNIIPIYKFIFLATGLKAVEITDFTYFNGISDNFMEERKMFLL